MAGEKFSTRGQCCVEDCEVALIVREDEDGGWTRVFACKHKLAKRSEYFSKLLYGNFKEKYKKEITIQDVTKAQLLPFLRWLSRYPKAIRVNDCESLCSLIFLADRFLCHKLEKHILKVLSKNHVFGSPLGSYHSDYWSDEDEKESSDEDEDEDNNTTPVEKFGTDAKLKLLEVAENHRGKDASILEACTRRCADLEIDQVSVLDGKVSVGTLAAVYATIGRVQGITLSRIKSAKGGPCCKRARMNLWPIGVSEIKKIKIDKNLFSA